jgi:hypothetical protein
MPTILRPKGARLTKSVQKVHVRKAKPVKLELTAEDIALDNAISTAAARGLAAQPR